MVVIVIQAYQVDQVDLVAEVLILLVQVVLVFPDREILVETQY